MPRAPPRASVIWPIHAVAAGAYGVAMATEDGQARPARDDTATLDDGGRTVQPAPPSEVDAAASPSSTAVGAAALRAAHLIVDQAPPILDDQVSIRLLEPGAAGTIESGRERLTDPHTRALRCGIVVRSRFAEDRLASSVQRDGVRQFLLLGAGLDTFAYRQPRWAHQIRIFEVDLPASQADKRRRLARAGIVAPPNLTYVAADFASSDLVDRLATAGFDRRKPAFAASLGVLIYLTDATVDRLLDAVSSFAAGTRFVFSFTRPAVGQVATPPRGRLAARAAELGEPWQSFMEPAAVEDRLRRRGFRLVTFAFPEDVTREYLIGRTDGLFLSPRSILADAIL